MTANNLLVPTLAPGSLLSLETGQGRTSFFYIASGGNAIASTAPVGSIFTLPTDNTGSVQAIVNGSGVLEVTQPAGMVLRIPTRTEGPITAFVGLSATVLGQVATRSRMMSLSFSTVINWMARTTHFARATITSMQVGFANWCASTVLSPGESGTGGPIAINASVEYPAGTFTQLLFSGSATGSIPDVQTLFSDFAAVNIPNGAQFWLRFFLVPSVGIVYQPGPPQGVQAWLAGGDALSVGGTNQTMGGTVVDSGSGNTMWPVAIWAQTSNPGAGFIGDSRVVGVQDSTMQSPGDAGELERPLGPLHAYCNVSTPGETIDHFLANSVLRSALLAKCGTIVSNLGVNDALAGFSAAQIEAKQQTLRATYSTHKFVQGTVAPISTGAWTLANGADQTVFTPASGVLTTLNSDLRLYPGGYASGFSGFVEIAQPSTLAPLTSGKWNADGTPAKYTPEGIHETTFALQQLAFTIP